MVAKAAPYIQSLIFDYLVAECKLAANYIEENSIKSEAKINESYQISKIIIALYHCKLLANSLAMITQLRELCDRGQRIGRKLTMIQSNNSFDI